MTASLTPEDGGYVARCVELDVTSEGDAVEEALMMLREAVELYLDVANRTAGDVNLSISAAGRGYDMAARLGDPELIGFTRWCWALQLISLTARGRASRVLTTGINELGRSVRLRGEITLPAEMLGFLHLSSAQCAARDKRYDDARGHLDEATAIAARIGERNGLRMHFGPTNVAVWRLGIGVELGEGGRAYEEVTRTPLEVAALDSQERSSALSCAASTDKMVAMRGRW